MMRLRAMPGARRCGGLAAVESAVALPVFIVLMLASAEFGRMLYQYNTLTKATRDAARYLAEEALVAGAISISSETTTRTRNLVLYGSPAAGENTLIPGLDSDDIEVTAVDANYVRVSVEYEYQPMFSAIPALGLGDGDAIDTAGTLQAACTMRAL